MSAEPSSARSTAQSAQRSQRSLSGNIAFACALVAVLLTTLLGAFVAVALVLAAADAAPLSSIVPDDGRNALVVGGIAAGALTGFVLPVVVFGMAKGNEETPRVGAGAAGRKLLALLAFDVYGLVLAVIVAQLGWVLPKTVTTTVAVFAIGFSWMPLAMIPRERLGLRSREAG
ncbi:hypothetical protein [Streptomyces sp. NPDC088794]|uniref:hypothetical protein n=1 Tax=Streptomyces sp. NPDC088794 TaxID=3365902 RepID=UPI0038146F64